MPDDANVAGLMDPQLRRGHLLGERLTPATAFTPLVERVRLLSGDGDVIRVNPDEPLTRMLAASRHLFQSQVVHDFSYNLQRLWHEAERLDPRHDVFGDARIRAHLRHLDAIRHFFLDNDQWSSSRIELACWNAFHQFYCEALALADRLWHYEAGRRPRRVAEKKLKRHERPGASSYNPAQALVNLVEQAIPNAFHAEPLRGLWPIFIYQGIRSLLPWPPWRSMEYLQRAHRILTAGTLANYGAPGSPVVERIDCIDLLNDPHFFDPGTRRTRQNIIFALSHRHSLFDLALMADVFGHIKIASWSNIQYFPKSAATDPLIVTVNPGETRRLERTLARTADLVIHQRFPITSYVDGGTPYLPYGQQMRVKPGIRLMVDYLAAQSRGTARRTYIVPVTYDDTVTFVRGLDSRITLTLHRPICADDIAAAPRRPDRKSINRGDPLLTYLEAHFLAHTGQVRHGWQTPCVIDTVRRTRARFDRDLSLRGRLRRPFHASIFDLCHADELIEHVHE